MPTLTDWTAYVVAVAVLMSSPGPAQTLMMASSIRWGYPRATLVMAGDLSANVVQMLLASMGLAALAVTSQKTFLVIQAAGVAWLVWLGVRAWLSAPKLGALASDARPEASPSLPSLWLTGFAASMVNPRAIVFFAALFPQFLTPGPDFWLGAALLGATYLAMDGSLLSFYGLASAWLARKFGKGSRRRLARVSAVLMILAAITLGLRGIG